MGLQRLAAEDPTLRIEQNPETHQIVLWCMGEAHAGVVLDALANRYGVNVDTIDVRIPLRETFGGPSKGHGRHVKQSGGHGQYAVCDIEVEPLPQGSGFEFVDRVVGGAVPRQFIPSVEKGMRAQMDKGVHAGYPVVDLRVIVFDGKHHPVDSKEIAFVTAARKATLGALREAKPVVLEPIVDIEITAPDGTLGDITGDLSAKRGVVTGTANGVPGSMVVRGQVPLSELSNYQSRLNAMTGGQGRYVIEFAHYQAVPPTVQQQLTAAYQAHDED